MRNIRRSPEEKYLSVLKYMEQNPLATTREACIATGVDNGNFYRYRLKFGNTMNTVEQSNPSTNPLISPLAFNEKTNNDESENDSVIVVIGSSKQVKEILSGLI